MRFDVANPTTGALLEVVPAQDRGAARAAVEEARRCGSAWTDGVEPTRAAWAEWVAELLLERADELAWRGAVELGVPVVVGIREVVQAAAGVREARALPGLPAGGVGAVVVDPACPWLAVPGVVGAVLAGGAAVVLSRGSGAGVSREVAALALQAGAPRGVVVSLCVSERGRQVVLDTPGVLALPAPEPAARLHVRQATPERAQELVHALCRCSGQDPAAPTRIQVDDAIHDAFIQALSTAMDPVHPADPTDPETRLGPLVRRDVRDAVHRRVVEAVRAGARILRGGVIPDGPGAFYPLTLVVDVPEHVALWTEGSGGPVVAVRRG